MSTMSYELSRIERALYDDSELRDHELFVKYSSLEPLQFKLWLERRSTEILKAARLIYGCPSPPLIWPCSLEDGILIDGMLNYAQNLYMLRDNIRSELLRLTNNSNLTTAQAQQLPAYHTTLLLDLIGPVRRHRQQAIDQNMHRAIQIQARRAVEIEDLKKAIQAGDDQHNRHSKIIAANKLDALQYWQYCKIAEHNAIVISMLPGPLPLPLPRHRVVDGWVMACEKQPLCEHQSV